MAIVFLPSGRVDTSGAGHASSTRLLTGEREPGMLTTFGAPDASSRVLSEGPATMDAATIAEREREGGGAPSQRRGARRRVMRGDRALAEVD